MPITARTHRIAALILVLALSLPLTARADEASHLAKAKEMMTLLQAQHMVDNISANILKQVSDAADKLAGPSPSPDKQAKLDDFKKQAAQVIDAQVGWKALQAGFADVYAKNFTEEQLDAIIAFYKTPAGVALLANMPTVNTQVGQLGNSKMTTLEPQIKQLYEDFQKSLTAAAPSLQPVPPAAPATAPTPSAPTPSAPK